MIKSTRKAVFLDRDGVAIPTEIRDGRPYAFTDLSNIKPFPELKDSIKKLKKAGFYVFIVTNQPDVANGKMSKEALDQYHAYLTEELNLDGVEMCCHREEDKCECRKPKIGMLTSLSKKFDIDLSQSFLIGDRWRDMDAATSAKCKAIFVDHGYREQAPKLKPDYCTDSAAKGCDWILRNSSFGN